MNPITVNVPTINDGLSDFDALFGLWSQVNSDGLDVAFDFSRCGFLRQNAVAFLGGLARLIEHRGGAARFDRSTLHGDVALNLGRNGFLAAFGDQTPFSAGNAIPFRQDLAPDKSILMDYLKRMWLGRGWVNVSGPARDAIVGQMWEIYANAFEHGESPIGVFCCGQHYPRLEQLKLAVVDFGVGIPSNARLFVGNHDLSAGAALRWAFQQGTTTQPNGMGRGIGLDLLRQFVKLNKGRLEVFSHEGYAVIDEGEERYETRRTFFEGTLVNIGLHCDETHYCLASEVADEPLF